MTKVGLGILSMVVPALALAAGLEVQTRINGVVGGDAQARALNTLELGYNLNGRPVVDFEINHEKKNHVIVVSEDLESYAHIHPEFARGGTFAIRLNDHPRVYDPDNQDAAHAIPKGGNYFAFTEVQPKGARAPTLVVTGFTAKPLASKTPLVADPVQRDKSIVKFFDSELRPSRPGDKYRVTLRTMRMRGMLTFNFRLEERSTAGGYTPFPVLEDWLGMPGHGILISDEAAEGSRVFRHMHFGMHHHPLAPREAQPTGEKVDFMLMGKDIPTLHGLYKIWAQVKVKGQVLTFPVVLEL